MFTQISQDTESYDYGITRSSIDNGQIFAVRTKGDMSREGTNTWASVLILTMKEWQSERPLALLHNFTHPKQGLTPYARQRSIDLMKRRPKDMTIYSAIVLPRTFMYHIIDMFLRTPIFHQDGHDLHIFRDEQPALTWLREKLSEH